MFYKSFVLSFLFLFLFGCGLSIDSPLSNLRDNNEFVDEIPDVMDGGTARPEYRKESNLYVKLATEYLRLGATPIALKNAKKSIYLDASNGEGHLILATVYFRLGENNKALLHYKLAAQYAPSSVKVNMGYANYLCTIKKSQEAIIYYDKAISNPLNQSRQYVYSNAGNCLLIDGDNEKASVYLRKALAIDEKFIPALLGMLRVRMKQKNYYSGRAFLERYLALSTHTPETLISGITIEQFLGETEKVKKYTEILQTKFADSPQARTISHSNGG